MTKKQFIALADVIREHNTSAKRVSASYAFDTQQIETLADFCAAQNTCSPVESLGCESGQ